MCLFFEYLSLFFSFSLARTISFFVPMKDTPVTGEVLLLVYYRRYMVLS
ncbi:hypothetical protein M6B38_328670 [Iris pallida]|uniref:Uncharacterized protein n=1 Tax=Iris pallida TaxID=29817 RepID=A0AAX6FUM5_IRIPA|nr:hypothetical protein M6B38_401260 [Iris pallida]KAJ6836087.1 hypothetical protein M6B38_328670 [Iris pallida]